MDEHNEQITEIEQLYRQVVEYDRQGDVYNAVKLCKRIARLATDWSAPFAYLAGIYKSRQEWKPTYHYSLKAVEHNPFDDANWENLALAATALEEWEIARQAWNHLGYNFKNSDEALKLDLGIVPVRLSLHSQPEIIEANRIDPVRAYIQSIPQPSSGRRYQDLILLDSQSKSSYMINGQKLPVYDELQLLKESNWKTHAVLLHTQSLQDIDTLAQLCHEANLGFDNWSNARRFFRSNLHPKVSEYFDHAAFGEVERDRFLVAIAAMKTVEIQPVLKDWKVITLQNFSGLECLF
ncbi:MAG: hypothetical protein AAB316_10755 [Bacteroidota bacterium]